MTFASPDSGATWLAPNGLTATLVPSGSNWTLTFKDGTVLTFNSAGKLTSEADANNNTVSYSYTGSNVTTITAANGQYISLSYNGSNKLTSATYSPDNGDGRAQGRSTPRRRPGR